MKLTNQVHGLSKEQLAARQVEYIDIATPGKDYWSYLVGNCSIDFSKFQSARIDRGPLIKGWQVRVFCNCNYVFLLSHESLACIPFLLFFWQNSQIAYLI